MPYKVIERDGQYCVFKHDADGNPVGETLGCHDTHEQANSQIAAVYASENKNDDLAYYVGGAIKALGKGRIGGYLVPFGLPKDAQGEMFTAETDFVLDFYGGSKRPIYYHHGQSDEIKTDEIGFIDHLEKRPEGLWAEGQLDMSNPYAQQRYKEVEQGLLGFSSGSAPHLVVVTKEGIIQKWPLVEASLTPSPSGGKRTTVVALKFADSAPVSSPVVAKEPDGVKERPAKHGTRGALAEPMFTLTNEDKAMYQQFIDALEKVGVDQALAFSAVKAAGAVKQDDMMGIMAACEKAGLSPDQTMAVMREYSAATQPETPVDQATMATDPNAPKPEDLLPTKDNTVKAAVEEKPLTAQQMRQIFEDALKSAPGVPQTQPFTNNPNGRTPRITDMRTPYHDLSWEDMSYLDMLRKCPTKPVPNSETFYREYAAKALKAYEKGEVKFSSTEEGTKAAREFAVKANELNNTVNDTSHVPTGWTTNLWEKARLDNVVAPLIETFEMPNDPYDYPIQSTDPTVYAVAEASATAHNEINSNVFTRSKIATSKVTFNAAKFGLQVAFSAEIEEDSVVQFIPNLRNQAQRVMLDAVDNLIINADDTTGTGNINYKGANTSAAATSKFLYGGGDGFRHLPLVTTAAAATDHGGAAPTLSAIRALRYKNGALLRAYQADRGNLFYLVDPETYGKLLNIDELMTFSVNGRSSTVQDGVVPMIDGSPVYQTNELALTDSTGYAMNDATGTLGQLLIVVRSRWKVGYRRRVATDVTYIPYNDEYVLTITARMALKSFDSRCAALLYNINVS